MTVTQPTLDLDFDLGLDLPDTRWSGSPAVEVQEALGDGWLPRAVYRDPCGLSPHRIDTWVMIFERSSHRRRGRRWCAVLLPVDVVAHRVTEARFDSLNWEQVATDERHRCIIQALPFTVQGPDPLSLVVKFAGRRRWPGMPPFVAQALNLHDPTVAAVGTLLSLRGHDGDVVRTLAALTTRSERDGHSPVDLTERIADHVIEDAVRDGSDALTAEVHRRLAAHLQARTRQQARMHASYLEFDLEFQVKRDPVLRASVKTILDRVSPEAYSAALRRC